MISHRVDSFLSSLFSQRHETNVMTMVEMEVHMCCRGCENKIRKALSRLRGVDSVEIDMEMQKVTVNGYVDAKKVLKAVRRSGKRAELWPYPYNGQYHPFTGQYYKRHRDLQNASSSSYNYYKHGYTGSTQGYFQTAPHSNIVDDKSSAMFSDDNPNSCTVM